MQLKNFFSLKREARGIAFQLVKSNLAFAMVMEILM